LRTAKWEEGAGRQAFEGGERKARRPASEKRPGDNAGKMLQFEEKIENQVTVEKALASIDHVHKKGSAEAGRWG